MEASGFEHAGAHLVALVQPVRGVRVGQEVGVKQAGRTVPGAVHFELRSGKLQQPGVPELRAVHKARRLCVGMVFVCGVFSGVFGHTFTTFSLNL